MRIKNIALTLTLALCSVAAMAQNSVFDKLAERKDIQAIHVSKSLLNMIPKMETGGANIAHLADKLKQIDVYSSESADAYKFMNTQAQEFGKNKLYEKFMTVKEKSQNVDFYGQKNGASFEDLIMVVNEGSTCKIIRFVGKFTAKDIQQVIRK